MILTNISTDALRPNDYNPNAMTEAEFAELVAEVTHLGGVPKPIVVRPNGDGYEIVDGEHGWRAAKEVGLEVIPCEVIECGDFEAMRQTYKRNQHGTHNPILQGLMFKRMMAAGGLSQRELAKDVEVSVGTVRNSLEYVKAIESLPAWLEVARRHLDHHEFEEKVVRNGYALLRAAGVELPPDDVRNGYALAVMRLSARQVRLLNRLPAFVAALWFASGADIRALHGSAGDPSEWEDSGHGMKLYEDSATRVLFELEPYGWMRNAEDFRNLRSRVMRKRAEVRRYTMGSFSIEELIPYFKRYWSRDFYVRDDILFEDAFKEIIDKSGHPAKLILSSEEWEAVFKEQHKLGGSATDFEDRLKLRVFEKLGGSPETFKGSLKAQILNYEIEHGAPDYIKNSKLKPKEKELLWKAQGPEFKKEELARFEELPYDWRRQLAHAEEDKATAEDPKSVPEQIIDVLLHYMQSNGLTLPEDVKQRQTEKLAQCDVGVLLALHDVLNSRYTMRQMAQAVAAINKSGL